MELTLRILVGLVTVICLLGGMNLLLKGAHYFLPEGIAPQRIMDDLMRFLSGIYFSFGFLLAWIDFNFDLQTDILYFIGLIVAFSGFGRLYSRFKVGSAGRYFDVILTVEILLGIAIIVLEYFR